MSADPRPGAAREAIAPLVRKLRHGTALLPEDEQALAGLVTSERRIARGEILEEGASAGLVPVVIQGWVCRYADLENGKRQITALFVPGDLCGPFGAVAKDPHQKLGAAASLRVAHLPVHALRDTAQAHPRIGQALWWDTLLADATAAEHMVNLGRRTALERLAHFLCEILIRLERVGLAVGSSCDFPLTQSDLGDLLGLTPVHVNRSMQELRRSGMISLRGRQLILHRPAALRVLSMFDPAYLAPSCVPVAGKATVEGWGDPGRQRPAAAMGRS